MPIVESVDEEGGTGNTDVILDGSVASEMNTSAAKSDGSANNSLENMESLLLNEDEDEDPIGTESLLMSGSEGEERDKISPVRRKKRATRMLDSDEENDGKQKDNSENTCPVESKDEDEERAHVANKPNKFSALIDSDSESDDQNSKEHTAPIDSDIEPDSSALNSKPDIQKKKKKSTKSNERKKSKSEKAKPVDSNSDDDSTDKSPQPNKNKEKSKISNLIDSDTESSNASDDENDETHHQKQEGAATTKRPKKQQRASAKKALDEMQAIQSESQRLHRETHVSIPYHKPKRHTLKEFLTRKTISTPQFGAGGSGKKLKMSPEELEAYAKHLEERAKEATEFFKSESEDELQATEDNEKEKEQEEVTVEAMQMQQQVPAKDDDIDKLVNSQVFSMPTTQELIDLEMPQNNVVLDEPIASTSTAVIEKDPPPEPSPTTSKLSELKRRLIAKNNLPTIPTLGGGPNMMIDFETGDIVPPKPTGLESLFQRFIKSNLNNKKPKESSLTTENNSDITKIDVSIIEEANKEKEPKPGAAYVKLKENLRTLISKKRKEDIKKKLEETQEEELEYSKCCGLDDEEEEEEKERERKPKKDDVDILIDDEENEIELMNDEDDDGDEDGDVDDISENNEEVVADEGANDEDRNEVDEVGHVTDLEEEDNTSGSDSDSDSNTDDDRENDDPATRKHRVIKAFEDSDDEKNELDAGLNTTLSTSVLFAEEEEKDPEEVESELLGLCSGQFEDSQRAPPPMSQIPITQTPGNVDDTELMDLCSGVFNQAATQREFHPIEEKQKTVTKIFSSDEEKEKDDEESTAEVTKKIKKLKKKKKKRANLVFSDEEDDEEEPVEPDLQDNAEEEEEEEVPQTFIDYDSEENEIEVQMSKKECLKQANTFLEKEAELSESEWGSADEDEQNLDKYDIELGDEDEFDREKIQAELGQIHMRKMLDDDIREVKKIQDMLFEDEEVDGVGRQRQFRWKNIESGFSLDNTAGGAADNDDGIDSADDEEEIKWRKMRFEREQLLQQKTKDEILAEVSATALGRTLLSTMEPDIKSDMIYEKEVLVAKEYKAPSFLIAQCDVKSLRGSFLNYDKETLTRIAAAAEKSGIQTDDDQLQNKASKTGNFVFAPLSEEEKALRKRKAEDVHNAKNGNLAKKLKPNSPKSLLLDKLL